MTPTVVWTPEVPPGPQRLIDLSRSGAVATPVKEQALIYTPELYEAIVCEFLAKEIML